MHDWTQQYSARGACLITERPFEKGQLICKITEYTIVPEPTYQTIQIGAQTHIENFGVLAYLNHACRPNTIVDTMAFALHAACDIGTGEELSFFYPSTEWEMARPFVCLCGASECIRLVAGARYLSVDVLSRYFINPHIRHMMITALDQVAAAPTQPAPVSAWRGQQPGLAALEGIYG